MAIRTNNSGTGKKKKLSFWRILFWLSLILVVLIVSVGLLTQTGMFRSWIRNYAVGMINESLEGELSIQTLDGNLYSNMELTGIRVVLNKETVLAVEKVRVDYSILPLLNNRLQIDSLAIDSVQIRLSQLEDSSWNLMYLTANDTANAPPVEREEASDYTIVVDNFVLSAVSAEINSLNPMIPRRVTDFGLHLSVAYESRELQIEIEQMQLATVDPDFRINDLRLSARADSSSFSLQEMELATVGTKLSASGLFYPGEHERSRGELVIAPLSLAEFAAFLPEAASNFNGDIKLEAGLNADELSLLLQAEQAGEQLDLTLSTSPLSSLLDSTSPERQNYKAAIVMEGIKARTWIPDSEFDYTINGNITVEGSGISPEQIKAKIIGDLSGSRWEKRIIKNLAFDLSLSESNLAGSLSTKGAFGEVDVTGEANNIFEVPQYDLTVNMAGLDLRQLNLVDTLETDLNTHVKIKGVGATLAEASGEIELTIMPSRILWLEVDQGLARMKYSAHGVQIDTLNIITSITSLAASGTISESEEGSLSYAISVNDSLALASFLGVERLQLKGEISGLLSGSLTEQQLEAKLEFNDIVYEDLKLKSAQSELRADISDGTILAQGELLITALESGDFLLDSISLTGEYSPGFSLVDASLWHALVQSRVKAGIEMDSSLTLSLDELDISYADQEWSLDEGPSIIIIDSSHYSINDLNLFSRKNKTETIRVDGDLDFNEKSDLAVQIKNLRLGPLGNLAGEDIKGSLNTEVVLSSPLNQPGITGELSLFDTRIREYDIHTVTGEFNYSDQEAEFDFLLKATSNDSLRISGMIPVAVDSGLVTIPEDKPLSVTVMIDSFPLDIMELGGNFIEEAKGFIDCNLTVSQTINDPAVGGSLTVTGNRISAPLYGVEYTDFKAGLSFQSRRISVDSISMRRGKGKFRLTGSLDFDNSLISGRMNSSRFDLLTDKFFVVRHRDYEIQLTSEIAVNGADSAAVYSGSIQVDRSRFYLPAFMEDMNESPIEEMTFPLLVEATGGGVVDSLIIDSAMKAAVSRDFVMANLMSRLSGRMKVKIPKNSWIKSPELSLELAGELEVVQEGPEPELFGNIRVVRGHYDLYGRRFKVQQGELIFQGGSYLNPTLNIDAKYTLRTPAREKKELRLKVTGTAEVPVILFTLDGADISEGDAVSYIIFGRSLDQLNQSQQSNLSGQSGTEQMAGKVATRMLAGQLAGALGRKLNMDIMEIKADGELSNATIVVGKYLTPDLFMSYQRSFGSSMDDDLEPEIVTLEYQLTRLIYLQLTEGDAEEAGFDFILKFERD
ncbi:MAG: translocation/assembly module TamB domain-containing protein [bacterium]|nr:translocation/assembly module TamB domain-containing protein [bacterium]